MSIQIADNFSYLGTKPLDARLKYDNVENMKGMATTSLYDGCLAYVFATKKYYTYDSRNETDVELGKWRELETGGSSVTDYENLDNKPSINNVTLIGDKSLSDLGIDIPENVSDLTNDVGFITISDVPEKTSELINDSNYISDSDYVHTDNNYTDTDREIVTDIPDDISAIQSALADKADVEDVPTKTSDLTNDSGFITSSSVPTKTSELTNDSGFITDANIPTKLSELDNDEGFITDADIPTKTSDLINDSGYITNADIPTKTSDLTNDSNFVSDASYVHTDNNFTNSYKTLVDGAVQSSQLGVTIAELDGDGKVPSSQLPSYVDDVIEYATFSDLPSIGESGIIYITLDTNLTYRWGGTEYVAIASDLALGETSSTAYRGDRGKIAYNHSQDPDKSAATNAGFYKVGATSNGHVTGLTAVTKSDVTALGITASDVGALPSSTVIPDKTSQLTNDSGFVTSSSIPTKLSELTNDAGYITDSDIPSNTSDFVNDGSDGTSTYVEADELSTVATTGAYSDLSGRPTDLTDFTNDLIATTSIAGTVKLDGSTIINDPSDVSNEIIKVNTNVIATQDDVTDVYTEIEEVDLSIPMLIDYTQSEIDDLLDDIDFSGSGSYYKNIKTGSTIISAYGEDTLEFIQGANITLTPDAANKTITIASTDSTEEMSNSDMTAIWNAVFA